MAYTTINKSTDYFNTKLYTGNGSSQSITGVGHQPDFVWIKDRDNTRDHQLFDAVRGAGKILHSNATNAEGTDTNRLSAFNSDGFSLGSSADVNDNSQKLTSWNWKAGTTSGIATNGETDITPTAYSFNQTNGFSIVKYTGTGTSGEGVPHGLNAKPQWIFVKRLNATESWQVFTQPQLNISNATKYLKLDATNAEATSNSRWNGWQPDTYNFYLGNDGSVNASGGTYIAYVFAAKTGYSKFGSYTGNGNANGTFCYTGFKPAWVILKRTDNTSRWRMYDNKINPFNVVDTRLSAESSDAENTSALNAIDMISQGFKIRTSESQLNASGGSFIYMAFAEAPLVGSNGVTAKAR
jgi:hypothetical protein